MCNTNTKSLTDTYGAQYTISIIYKILIFLILKKIKIYNVSNYTKSLTNVATKIKLNTTNVVLSFFEILRLRNEKMIFETIPNSADRVSFVRREIPFDWSTYFKANTDIHPKKLCHDDFKCINRSVNFNY